MIIGVDASRANLEKKTGVEFYSYFLIQELKKIISSEHQVLLYSPDPLRGELANLPANWKWQKVRSPINPAPFYTILTLWKKLFNVFLSLRQDCRIFKERCGINLSIGKFAGDQKLDELKEVKTSQKLPIGNFWEGGGFRKKRPFLWTQLALSLEMLRRPPDILFVPSHALPFICPKNSFVTIHDIGFDRFPQGYNSFARFYHRFATRFAVWRAKKLITISEFSKKELIDVYHARSEKIVAIPIGYDSSRFHANLDEKKKQQVLQKYGLMPIPQSSTFEIGKKVGNGYIFYVGRLEKKKNIVTLIKAFEILYTLYPIPYTLVLAGTPAYGYNEIQKAIEDSPVRDRIKILNYVDEADLPYLMASASLFVFPSLYEGFGIPVLEAMVLGTPVVASDIPALREVAASTGHRESRSESGRGDLPVEQDAALFANPNSPEDFTAKIKQVLENDTMRQMLIVRGLEQVKKYSWAETARLTLEVLTQ